MSTELWATELDQRQQAWRRPFECDLPGTPEEFVALAVEGERRGWPEVTRAGIYGSLRHAAEPAGSDPRAEIARLVERSTRDGDLDMLALSLAWRAWTALAKGLDTGSVIDDDLAKTAVILGSKEGNPVIKATAHFRVAFCYMHRNLWELADEQFAAAEEMVDSVDPLGKDPLLHRAALAYDRVMVQLDWGCALRAAGGAAAAQERRQVQQAQIASMDTIDMPQAWREHVRIAGLVLGTVAGEHRADEVRACLEAISSTGDNKELEGYLHLALALSPDDIGLDEATAEADRALATIDGNETRAPYDLALHQATVLEAAAVGKRTAGLRSAEELAVQREHARLMSTAAMRAVIAAERLRNERDVLARHAYIDHLTGLENRRSFDRHVSALQEAGVGQVSVLLFDVDHFKLVNDSWGHAAGDTVLKRVSDILTANVRSGDFAARVGGDEFVLVLAESGYDSGVRRSEAIARDIAAQAWRDVAPGLKVSVSVGVAAGHPGALGTLNQEADAALYRAKARREQLSATA